MTSSRAGMVDVACHAEAVRRNPARRRLAAALLLLSTCTLHPEPIRAVAFAPDGTALVSNSHHQIDVRSPVNAAIQRTLKCDLPRITALAFDPRGRFLAVAGGDPGLKGEIQLLAWPDGRLVTRLGGPSDLVTCMAWNSHGSRLGAGAADNACRIWPLNPDGTPSDPQILTGHAGPVLALGFSPTDATLATASADRSLKVWSTKDGRLLRTFTQHTEAIHALAFKPRPPEHSAEAPAACVTGGDDRTVRLWQPEIGRMVRIIRQHQGPVFALAWLPDGSACFSAGKEGIIRRLDAGSDAIEAAWHDHADWIHALAVSPDGQTLASGDWSGQVRLRSLR